MICFLYDKAPHILADIKSRDNLFNLTKIIQTKNILKLPHEFPFIFQRQCEKTSFQSHNILTSPSHVSSLSSSIFHLKV